MATIRKRGNRWQVQVRRRGCLPRSRTFDQKKDARIWARQMEAAADRRGLPAETTDLAGSTVGDLITRYRDTVVPRKRGAEIETYILNAFMRHKVARLPLSEISSEHFSRYRDERLERVKPVTVSRELGIIQHAFEVARNEWSIPLPENPLTRIKKPTNFARRDRRLEDGELDRILEVCRTARRSLYEPLIRLAIETAMRRGELVNLRWCDIDWEQRTLHIPNTKNGHPRTIPLSREAVSILEQLRGSNHERVIQLSTNSVRLAWGRLTKRADIEDLHFHDLRHEAISRFFERGLSLPEVALISGHRDHRMLLRYTHLRPENLVAKLDANP